jgi:hypothetical protein
MKRPRLTPALMARIEAALQTDEGMSLYLTRLFGADSFAYDADEDVWVIPDASHQGPGRGFMIMRRGGHWFKAVLPAAAATH